VWAVAKRRRGSPPINATSEALSILVWLVVLPALIYVTTYIGRLDGSFLAAPWSDGSWMRAWWDKQWSMADFHFGLESTHGYQSPAWSWLLLKRPVSYFFCAGDECATPIPDDYFREVLATGNPFVWWPSVLALAYVAVRWWRTRDFTRPEGLIVGGFAYTYFPWLALSLISDRSATFIFYLLPTLPFMMLAIAYVAVTIGDSWEARAAISLFCVGVVALFAFYYPVTANIAIPRDQWERRIWIFDNCDKPEGVRTKTTITETTGGRTVTRTKNTKSNESLPPTGWCWI
jgi:dolichyl-phosphate-mannose-protein mannosyltransferase